MLQSCYMPSSNSKTCKDCGLEFPTFEELQEHLSFQQYDSIHTDKATSLQLQIKLRAEQIKKNWLENKWCNQ